MKDRVVVRDPDHVAIREDLPKAAHEDLPFESSVEVVHHQKTSAIQILTEALGLRAIEFPMSHFDGVEPGVVEQGAVVDVDDFFHGLAVDTGEPTDHLFEEAVGAVRIDAPTLAAALSTAASQAAATA